MPKTNGIASRLKAKGLTTHSWKNPLWLGPRIDGITQSMIGRWLCCRERFKLKVIDGLAPLDTFNVRLEYGNMWHVCEEDLARGEDWSEGLKAYCRELAQDNPTSVQQITHWYNVCKIQFPIYVDRWKNEPDAKDRTNLFSEEVFRINYKTRGGNQVILRGKFDSVDKIGKEIQLQENKSKGDIDEADITTQMDADLQTMLYLIALEATLDTKVERVLYNVVRRPLAGGKHSIKQRGGRQTKKGLVGAESTDEFYERLRSVITENRDDFFFRLKVKISRVDLERFRKECLDPILDQICQWYDAVTGGKYSGGIHYRFPYGVFNATLEGMSTDVDHYLRTGSMVGLTKVKSLFRELE